MKLNQLVVASLLLTSLASGQGVGASRELAFQPNLGQGPSAFDFVARGREYALSLSRDRAVLGAAGGECGELSIALELVGAQPGTAGEPADPRATRFAYFRGRDETRWQRDVPSFGAVRYDAAWPGIDVVYLGVEGRLQYDFHVAPHADPSAIRLRLRGVARLAVQADGSLALDTHFGRIVQPAPTIFQERHGVRELVRGGYALVDELTLGFTLGAWDRERELVIDPTVVWQSLIEGAGSDEAECVRVAPNGNLWITGSTDSSTFPLAAAGVTFTASGERDVFVSEFDPTGQVLLFSALIGGADVDEPSDMALVGDGDVVVCGDTQSTDFPAMTNSVNAPVQATLGGVKDAFVFRLTEAGVLEFSTYLGGSAADSATGVGLVAGNDVVVVGWTASQDFPLHNAAQPAPNGGVGSFDGFVSRIAAPGDTLAWSTYCGTTDMDAYWDLAVDPSDDSVVLAGSTQFSIAGQLILQRVNANGSFGTLRTFGDPSFVNIGRAVAIAADGSIATTIETTDTSFVTVDPLAGQDQGSGGADTVLGVWDATLTTLQYATYLGGASNDIPEDLALRNGRAYALLNSHSANLPTLVSMGAPFGSTPRGYLACIDLGTTPPVLEWASYLPAASDCSARSVALDAAANGPAYVTGWYGPFFANLEVFPSTGFGAPAGASEIAFLMRLDPALATGTPVVGFGSQFVNSVMGTSQTFVVYRWDGTDTDTDVAYTVASSSQALPGLNGTVHFDAGEQIERLTLNWSGVLLPTMYLSVTLQGDENVTVDPNRSTVAFMVNQVVFETSSSDDDECCGVATVSANTPMSRDLDVMRAFRDRVLSRFEAGRNFTSWYYRKLSPTAVRFMREHPASLPLAQAGLWSLLFALKYPIELAGVALALVMLRWHQKLARARSTGSLAFAR